MSARAYGCEGHISTMVQGTRVAGVQGHNGARVRGHKGRKQGVGVYKGVRAV